MCRYRHPLFRAFKLPYFLRGPFCFRPSSQDPGRPISIPAVTCGGTLSSRVLRVYYGSNCQLWKQDNAANCYWNATKQANPHIPHPVPHPVPLPVPLA